MQPGNMSIKAFEFVEESLHARRLLQLKERGLMVHIRRWTEAQLQFANQIILMAKLIGGM